MGKKKSRMSLFSTFVQEIHEHDTKASSSDYHLIDNEYFAAFDSLDDIQQFHNKLTEKQQEQPISNEEDDNLRLEQDDNDMDMKSFAQQFLVDLPEQMTTTNQRVTLSRTPSQEIFSTDQPINWSPTVKDNKRRKTTTPVKLNVELSNKRHRRNVRDLPQSSNFIFMSDNDHHNSLNSSTNIFDCLHDETSSNQIEFENMNSILLTLNVSNKQQRNNKTSVSLRNENEEAETSIIKNEPIESEQLIVEAKEEPTEMTSTDLMTFDTSEYSGGLDNYVQNIHLRHQSSTVHESDPNLTASSSSLRPQRIRKRKKFYIEETELITRPKKLKIPIRKKRPPQAASTLNSMLLTDAEIEQQFGERLPIVKSEHDDETQQVVNSRVVIEFEPVTQSLVPQTPLEKARAKLMTALGRGHDPDTYLLKIRSREHKIIEVQLAIYGTADWHLHRTKILLKIEEALRGLRVSWTKIDIRVDDFDIQICTSSQVATISPPTSLTSTNSSWFLKALSESGSLIVHIHDRRYPQQRYLIKCSCPQCSPTLIEQSIDSSLPIIVNVSPATTPTRRLTTPTILNKAPQTNISSLHNIDTTFFNDLIHQWGRNTVISVTQCVLDLALIVSVHTSLPNLCVSSNYSKEEYKNKYQQIIDPLKCTINENEKIKTPLVTRIISVNSNNNTQSIILSQSPDILTFYDSIKENKANIRSAKSMRHLITSTFSTPTIASSPSPPSNMIKGRTLILPKPTSPLSLANTQSTMAVFELKKFNEQNRRSLRRSSQNNRYDKHTQIHLSHNDTKQQAHFTPIIELKPIMGGSTITTQNIHSFIRENKESITIRDSCNNELKQITTIISTNTGQNEPKRLGTITNGEVTPPLANNARVIRLSIAKTAQSNGQQYPTSPPTIRLVAPALMTVSSKNESDTSSTSHSNSSENKGEAAPLVPKQINIIKPFSSSSITPAIKLSNPILISNKPQQPLTK